MDSATDREGLRLGEEQERASLSRHSGRQSTLQQELPRLLPFLAATRRAPRHRSRVLHALRARGTSAGSKIGQMDASDVNYAIEQLAKLVDDKNLPPKVLVVHRFTRSMVPERGARSRSIRACRS